MKYAQYIIMALSGIVAGMILLATYQRLGANNVTTPIPPKTPPSGPSNKTTDGQVSVNFGGGPN